MEELIIEKLRKNGYKASRHSIIIYKILKENNNIKNISEIKEALGNYYMVMSNSNIKKIINRLEKIGLLTLVRNNDGENFNIRIIN